MIQTPNDFQKEYSCEPDIGLEREITEAVIHVLYEYPRMLLHMALTPEQVYVPDSKTKIIKHFETNAVFHNAVQRTTNLILKSVQRWRE